MLADQRRCFPTPTSMNHHGGRLRRNRCCRAAQVTEACNAECLAEPVELPREVLREMQGSFRLRNVFGQEANTVFLVSARAF